MGLGGWCCLFLLSVGVYLSLPKMVHHCHLQNMVTLGKDVVFKTLASVAAHNWLLIHRDWCEALWNVFTGQCGMLQIKERGEKPIFGTL